MRTESIALVKRFLDLLEARDLDGARALVCGDFEMVFPGNARFTRFEELIAWAAPRYGWVRKRHERFDAAPAEDGKLPAATANPMMAGRYALTGHLPGPAFLARRLQGNAKLQGLLDKMEDGHALTLRTHAEAVPETASKESRIASKV